MHKNFYGWSLESVHEGTVDTKYTVEYINDSKIADELERSGDPALYNKREFDNADEAFVCTFPSRITSQYLTDVLALSSAADF